MISKIDKWFSEQSFVLMTIAGQWIGRPMDNVYTYEKSEECKEGILIYLDNGWIILCLTPQELESNKNELVLGAESFHLRRPNSESKDYKNGYIRFFTNP